MKPDKSALDIPDDALRELMTSGMNMGDVAERPAHPPLDARSRRTWKGSRFVHALRRKGGWTAVDRAWDRLPTTTEQILHVDKWEANEGPIAVPAPTGARARRRLEEGRRGHVRRARLRAHVRGVDGRRGRAQGAPPAGAATARRCSRRAIRSPTPCTSATTRRRAPPKADAVRRARVRQARPRAEEELGKPTIERRDDRSASSARSSGRSSSRARTASSS